MKKNYSFIKQTFSFAFFIFCSTNIFSQIIQISDEAGLKAINNKKEGHYQLTQDITLTADWSAIYGFKGTLDGNGKVIKGLKINAPGVNFGRAMFEYTENATIVNLGIEDAEIIAGKDAAAFVGKMSGGLISKCYIANSIITGKDHVAAFVGDLTGGARIENCYAAPSVYVTSTAYAAGGLVGVIHGATVSKSYFAGIAKTPSNQSTSAGIVSMVQSHTDGDVVIEYCVNLAESIFSRESFRITNWFNNERKAITTLTDNYSLGSTLIKEGTENVVLENNADYGTDLRHGANIEGGDENAKKKAFYESIGWNFTDVWDIDEDKSYPTLKVFKAIVVGIDENEESDQYTIHSSGRTLYIQDFQEEIKITIYSTTGSFVLAEQVAVGEFAYTLPTEGVYIVKIAGKKDSIEKVLIK